MAMDEALLRCSREPVLRCYHWEHPVVSLGYFTPLVKARRRFGSRDFVRRLTGGGMVAHGDDFTFALVLPNTHISGRLHPAESYEQIHSAVAAALVAVGVDAVLGETEVSARSSNPGLCFESPVRHDLICDGKKIAGGAQKRSREGLLHQGTIQGGDLGGNFGELLAEKLGRSRVTGYTPDEGVSDTAAELEKNRYGTGAWLERF